MNSRGFSHSEPTKSSKQLQNIFEAGMMHLFVQERPRHSHEVELSQIRIQSKQLDASKHNDEFEEMIQESFVRLTNTTDD